MTPSSKLRIFAPKLKKSQKAFSEEDVYKLTLKKEEFFGDSVNNSKRSDDNYDNDINDNNDTDDDKNDHHYYYYIWFVPMSKELLDTVRFYKSNLVI